MHFLNLMCELAYKFVILNHDLVTAEPKDTFLVVKLDHSKGATMPVSMLDQFLFPLACGHEVVLGRMANLETWVCEACGKTTDLSAEPFKSSLARDLDTAMQIDAQERARGNTITRLA